MKKTYLLLATTAMVMAGCANEDFVGETPTVLSENQPIGFNMNVPATTRAQQGGATAATTLGNEFIVWGEKNETDGYKADAENLVFENYVVKHDEANTTSPNYTSNSTTSNTNGWEYVGIEPYDAAKVEPSIGKTQTIKYWDTKASSYTFTAVSAKHSDIEAGNVIIKKTVGETKPTGTATTTPAVYDKGYTIEVKSPAETGSIYYADRINVLPANYKNVVTLTFRNFQSKVRFGIYENIPGYHVVITNVKYNNGASHTPATTNPAKDADKFGVDGNFIIAGDATKYAVSYENASSSYTNKVKVSADASSNTQDYFVGGTGILETTDTKPIGTAANAPTWDNEDYTAILPNPSNSKNMKLTISYNLISDDTKEIIVVEDKTAEVPAEYCQWKSNYAYSYIFKITDKSADLYPITFDACVETDEIGNQETITTVSEPSITTFATTADLKSYKTKGNEYVANDVIYATVVEGNKVVTLDNSASGNVKLYTVTTSDATNFPITEASVAHALAQTSGTTTNVKPVAATVSNTTVTDVPTEDGQTVKLSNNGKALTWTAETDKVYAVEYTYTDSNNKTQKVYKVIKIGGATGQQ